MQQCSLRPKTKKNQKIEILELGLKIEQDLVGHIMVYHGIWLIYANTPWPHLISMYN